MSAEGTNWILDVPDLSGPSVETGLELPPLLWQVGNQSLAAHWMDAAVRAGIKRVVLHCPDRPAAVRAALEGGVYWSIQLEVSSTPAPEGTAHHTLDHFPGQPATQFRPSNSAELLDWWARLCFRWLACRDRSAVSLDSEQEPEGWIGPRARIAPSAKLVPPYWIGAGSAVGHRCTIGPFALIGEGCVLSENITVQRSIVLPGTFLGPNLELEKKALSGPRLLDLLRGSSIVLADSFIASGRSTGPAPAPWIDRLFALLLLLPAWILHLLSGTPRALEVRLGDGPPRTLAEGTRGPLLARRARWLHQVIAGRMHLAGPLPRAFPPSGPSGEMERLLAATPPGVFALSDLHGVHSSADPEEFAHALYQAAIPDADRQVRRALASLLFLKPGP